TVSTIASPASLAVSFSALPASPAFSPAKWTASTTESAAPSEANPTFCFVSSTASPMSDVNFSSPFFILSADFPTFEKNPSEVILISAPDESCIRKQLERR
ncbi:hypothetical protein PMAYCL1PPCAC_09578, partial [Pristionchus mayeri]